jgi:hypothetical protein
MQSRWDCQQVDFEKSNLVELKTMTTKKSRDAENAKFCEEK